jgi:hypothetical protein
MSESTPLDDLTQPEQQQKKALKITLHKGAKLTEAMRRDICWQDCRYDEDHRGYVCAKSWRYAVKCALAEHDMHESYDYSFSEIHE